MHAFIQTFAVIGALVVPVAVLSAFAGQISESDAWFWVRVWFAAQRETGFDWNLREVKPCPGHRRVMRRKSIWKIGMDSMPWGKLKLRVVVR